MIIIKIWFGWLDHVFRKWENGLVPMTWKRWRQFWTGGRQW